jgi:thioredoxin-related protein
MRRSTVSLFVVLLLLWTATAALAADVHWQGWDAGLAAAKGGKRYILVDVYTDWCGWCKRMDREVYARDDIRDYLERHFVTVRLNAESNESMTFQGEARTARGIASGYRVTGYPTTIFLSPEGEHLANVPNYVPADRFLLLLRYIGEGYMDKGVKWEDYVAQTRADK